MCDAMRAAAREITNETIVEGHATITSMEWQEFPEGDEPEILTGVSEPCDAGNHAECPGHAPSDEHGGQTVFCICPCHQVPAEA
jgi:hypothetical protein